VCLGFDMRSYKLLVPVGGMWVLDEICTANMLLNAYNIMCS
jgi:hypothetical protein